MATTPPSSGACTGRVSGVSFANERWSCVAWTTGRRKYLLDTHIPDLFDEIIAENPIPIP